MKIALVALALLALAMASACGSDDDNGDESATPASDANGQPAGQPGPDAPTVSIDTSEVVVGDQGEAELTVLNFNSPGLGAWTIDVQYDASVVSVVTCEPLPEGSVVCNAEYADDTVRIVGATGTGYEGDTVIGRITFQCDAAGESNLDIVIETLADGTLGDPQLVVPNIENGTITCTA